MVRAGTRPGYAVLGGYRVDTQIVASGRWTTREAAQAWIDAVEPKTTEQSRE